MPITEIFTQLGIAIGLGMLVGLQRQSVASRLGGLRTFPILTLFGSLSALTAQIFGGWIVAAGMIALAGLIFIEKLAEAKMGQHDPGLTTEIAMLLMYGVGVYLIIGYSEVAIAVSGGIAALLHFKGELHDAVRKLNAADLKAIMQFALISMVILPVLPNRAFGPYQILNPRNIWLMIVLIVGINLSGYIIYKFFGEKAGLLLGGVLGGLISSTATTVSFSRRSASNPDASRSAAIVILIASSIVFGRVLLEITTVAPSFFRQAAAPILLIMVAMAISAGILWIMNRNDPEKLPQPENPSELKSALIFGLLYTAILLAVAFANDRLGDRGLYMVAAISGLTDVDAITLSTSQMVNLNRLDATQGWRLIVIAILSNVVFKTAIIAIIGHRRLFYLAGTCLGLTLLVGIAILLLWPA